MYRALVLLTLIVSNAYAGLFIPAGDLVPRHHIQRLANHGINEGPTSTWPLAWGPILDDLSAADSTSLPPGVANALARVQQRTNWGTCTQELSLFNLWPGHYLTLCSRKRG